MKILICGLGSMGRRYAGILTRQAEHEVYAFRTSSKKGIKGVPELLTWGQVERLAPDCALICTPTNTHIEYGLKLAQSGVHFLMEKPIGVNSTGLEQLMDSVRLNKVVTYVAYPFRHHLGLIKFKTRVKGENQQANITCLTDGSKWVKEYSEDVATGGGALLELSHEIDLAAYLFGDIASIKVVECDKAKPEKFIKLIIIHRSGTVCDINLNMTSKYEYRSVTFQSSNQHIVLDYNADDTLYATQLGYFLNGVKDRNMSLINNLFNAVDVFQHIAAVKDNL